MKEYIQMNNNHEMIDFLLGTLPPEATAELRRQQEEDPLVAKQLALFRKNLLRGLEGDGVVAAIVSAAEQEISKPNEGVVSLASHGDWPGAKLNCHFEFAQSLAPSKERTYPLAAPEPVDRFGQEENGVFIRCDVTDIPSGLCRLEVRETDGTITWYYPRFRRIADRWIFHESIENILGRRPTSRNVEVAVITATAETRDQFCNNEKVREAVASWPSESKQRELAEEFLKGSHE